MKSHCKHLKGFRGWVEKKCEFKELPNKTLLGEPTPILTRKVPPGRGALAPLKYINFCITAYSISARSNPGGKTDQARTAQLILRGQS